MSQPKIRIALCFLFFLCFSLFVSSSANAQVHPGIRGGGYFDDVTGAFIGGEVLASMPWDHWYFNPNVEFAFGDRVKEATINFDFHYDLPTHSSLYFWVGGGPAIQFFNPDNPRLNTETDFAVNIFMGVGFNKGGSVIPYLQPKVILSSRSAFSIAFGIRF